MRYAHALGLILSLGTLAGCNDSTITALPPGIEIQPETLAFSAIAPGEADTKTVMIRNRGSGALTVNSLDLGGDTPASFSTDAGTSAMPLSLSPGASALVQVTYAPGETGPHAGVLTIRSTDRNRPAIDVALETGVFAPGAGIVATPPSLAFGNVDRGSCKTLSTSIANHGLTTLNISSVYQSTGTSAEYEFAPSIFSVAPGEASDLSVTYCPFDGGVDGGALEIASNDAVTPVLQLPVSGKGLIPIPANTDIAVQLEWDKPNTDVDLHVMRMTTAGTFAWNTSDDCYYNNCKQAYSSKPDWGVVGDHTDDPYLDQDVVTGSPGPENINLAIAATTTYRVGAYYFGDHGNGPTNATMRIWLNNTLVFESAPMHIVNLERWVAADIAWDASTDTGTVTAVGTTMQMFSFAQQTK